MRSRPRAFLDARAQVGIGTMIVFIAAIIVAAAGATLLLDTSGKLQERSSQVGSEATREIATNLVVRSVYGVRSDPGGDLEAFHFTASLAAGALPIDLSQIVIDYSDGAERIRLAHASARGGDVFVPQIVRDPQGMFSPTNPIVGPGAMVEVQIDLTEIGDGRLLAPRTDVDVAVIPEFGTPLSIHVTTPLSLGTQLVVPIR